MEKERSLNVFDFERLEKKIYCRDNSEILDTIMAAKRVESLMLNSLNDQFQLRLNNLKLNMTRFPFVNVIIEVVPMFKRYLGKEKELTIEII